MIGVWFENGESTVRDDFPDPDPGEGDAVVAVSLAGICGTDLALLAGYRGFRGIPGHEFVGVVEDGPPAWRGARVVADINVTCDSYPPASDRCVPCRRGRRTHCERRAAIGIFGRDGAFAREVVVPLANLHRVPVSVTDEVAVFAEPVAAAYRVLEQVEIGPETRALVVGPGRLGQLVARVLATTGCRPTVTGRSAAGLERARLAGLTTLPIDEVEGRELDVAVDCTGHADGFEVARRSVRPAGTVVVKSTYSEPFPVDMAAIAVDEINVIGSRCGPFAPALAALADGSVRVDDLVDDRFPLGDAPRALARAGEPGVLKVLLVP